MWKIEITKASANPLEASSADICPVSVTSSPDSSAGNAHRKSSVDAQEWHMSKPIGSRLSAAQPIGGSVAGERRGCDSLATLGSLGVVAVVSTWRQRQQAVEIRGYFGWMAVCLLLLNHNSFPFPLPFRTYVIESYKSFRKSLADVTSVSGKLVFVRKWDS